VNYNVIKKCPHQRAKFVNHLETRVSVF